MSSRNDQDIVCSLSNYPDLKISSEKNSIDIVNFVHSKTETMIKEKKLLRYSSAKDKIKKQIIEEVIQGADGM